MHISFVAAMSENRVIGHQGSLPWHLPHDLKRFKSLTVGQHVLMGRKTFLSIGQLLPKRHNWVLTRDPDFSFPALGIFHSKEAVLKSEIDHLMVIGGEQIYELFLPECSRIYLTLVHAVLEGDAYFPKFENFTEVSRSFHEADERHKYAYSFIEYRHVTDS